MLDVTYTTESTDGILWIVTISIELSTKQPH
jgi:hypothetical protein